jgi:Lipocalin-like domain
MNCIRAFTMTTASLLSLGLALFCGDAAAQSAKSIVGAYTLVSVEGYGPGAKGLLILDASGRYSITITRADLPKFASNSRVKGTADENQAVVGGSIAHFGRYAVNAAAKTITFSVESSTFPNWNGTSQTRPLTVTKDELKYTVAVPSAGGPANEVVWTRAK